MSYYIWLDDYRPKPRPSVKEWVIAKDMEEFKKLIRERGLPDYISFDHDLNEDHYYGDYSDNKTGLDCMIWLIDYVKTNKLDPPLCGIHTMNVKRLLLMSELLNTTWPDRVKSYVDML